MHFLSFPLVSTKSATSPLQMEALRRHHDALSPFLGAVHAQLTKSSLLLANVQPGPMWLPPAKTKLVPALIKGCTKKIVSLYILLQSLPLKPCQSLATKSHDITGDCLDAYFA